VFSGVISNFSVAAESENQSAMFSIALTVIDHSLPAVTFPAVC
jgi:hypothetical protein